MGKRKRNSGASKAEQASLLPQNFVLVGEHSAEDKKIYLSQSVYKEIHRFAGNKTATESGGVLLGDVIEDMGKAHIIVRGFVEARYCEATPTTLTFTHRSWDYIHREADRHYRGMKILGWIHTHPDFGIFLSEYDSFIQQNFFSGDNQIAYVVDPVRGEEGLYFWRSGTLEHSKGFFVFDKTGVKLTVTLGRGNAAAQGGGASAGNVYKVLCGLMAVIIAVLLLLCVNLQSKYKALVARQAALENAYNCTIVGLQEEIESLSRAVASLQSEGTVVPDGGAD